MYKTFGETIASLRRAHGMRQQTLANALAEAGVPVSNQAVSKWENDATLPNAQQFLTLCRVLDVDDIAGTFSGGDAGGLLAGLNAEGRRRALEYIALLRESKRFAAAPEPGRAAQPARCTRWRSRPVRASFSTARAMRCSRSAPRCRRRQTSACAWRATVWSRAFTAADRLGAPAADARPRRDRRVSLRRQRLSQAAPARRRARVSALAQPGLCRSGDLGRAAAARARKSDALITNKKLPAERMVSAGSFSFMPHSSAAGARTAPRPSAPWPPRRRPPARPGSAYP